MPRILQCCPGCSRQYEVGSLAPESPVGCSCGISFPVTRSRAHAPRALCCSRCGGNLQQAASSCEYCNAQITLEERQLDSICPACFARMSSDANFCMSCGIRIEVQALAALPSDAGCPRCKLALRSRRVGSEVLVECGSCGGLWVDPKLLERLCDDAGARQSVSEVLGSMPPRSQAARTALAYIPCPNCRQPMNRKNFGSISGILIDACKDHGVWLDHGELARALAFAERGGLVEARRREVGELERRGERAASEASPGADLWLDTAAHAAWSRSDRGGLLGWLARQLLR